MHSTDISEALSMDGKVVLVTGASSGLGAHFARVLAAAGASVAVGARRVDKLESLVSDIGTRNGNAIAVELDVTLESSVESALDQIEEAFGPGT